MIFRQLRTSIIAIVVFTALTGVFYPLAVTAFAQLVFPGKANGSIVTKEGKIAGSELIGQPFSDPKYFWSRPSATGSYAYNAGASSGSNYGPLNPALIDQAKKRIADMKTVDSLNVQSIPVDLVTASGSGLDPHISVAAALYQIPRVARARKISETDVRSLVDRCTQSRDLGFLGEPRVNVLELNLALDSFHPVEKEK